MYVFGVFGHTAMGMDMPLARFVRHGGALLGSSHGMFFNIGVLNEFVLNKLICIFVHVRLEPLCHDIGIP